jgi:hypothetical protein
MQATIPPGGMLESLRVEIDREDPKSGVLSMDEESNVLIGSRSVKKDWKKGNSKLADELDAPSYYQSERSLPYYFSHYGNVKKWISNN